MKVTITEVTGIRDLVLAEGLKSLVDKIDLNIEVSLGGSALAVESPAPAARPPASAPVVSKRGRKTGNAAKATKPGRPKTGHRVPKSPKAAPLKAPAGPSNGDAPRVTIRSRIYDLLAKGPRKSIEVRKELGFGDEINVTQHLYLMQRDGLVARDEETEMYRRLR